MSKNKELIKIGIVGACARGGDFKIGCEAAGLKIQAVCDINEKKLSSTAKELGAKEQYADYDTMLKEADITTVIIGTPMQFHASQSIAALEQGLNVLCEVPAAISIDECKELVKACEKSDAIYMMAENYIYIRECMLVKKLVADGHFAQPYFAEGEYLHELKELNEETPWRRKWQTGISGITYGTHSLGPILQWMPGDRVVSVSCMDADARHKDPRGDEYAQMTPVMLCKTAKGALIKIRVDLLSNRPHDMTRYSLQGMDASFEYSDNKGGSVWFKDLSKEIRWHDTKSLSNMDALAQKYLPKCWHNPSEEAKKAGHGGGDYFEILDFVKAINGEKNTIDIHVAMDMTLPCLISQESVKNNSKWLKVPDSRSWVGENSSQGQLMMQWPQERLSNPTELRLAEGYTVRCYENKDEAEYLRLLEISDFADGTKETIDELQDKLIPKGLLVIEHKQSGNLVATALCNHKPSELFPAGGELGLVIGDPAHKGRGLGYSVCAAVTNRFIEAGYENIYLSTDDFRLPAIKTYLTLGYLPVYHNAEMRERWEIVFKQLGLNEKDYKSIDKN